MLFSTFYESVLIFGSISITDIDIMSIRMPNITELGCSTRGYAQYVLNKRAY